MKRMLAVGAIVLTTTMMLGCNSESERMATMAERMMRSQNEVNSSITKTNETFVDLNKDFQQERTGLQNERLGLNQQFEQLEQDRRDLHRQRRSEVAWSESFRFLAIVFAAAMPLFLCAYLIWATSQSSVEQEEVNTILLQELTSPNPRLVVAPNLSAIEHRQAVGEQAEPETKQEN